MADQDAMSGTLANAMDYVTWGSGPKTLICIQGGPGSAVPKGLALRASQRWFEPFVRAEYTVWTITRRRNMPSKHGVADIADDYAQVITEVFGGRVDLVLGVSYGGMIGQYLAAQHGACLSHLAIVAAAAQVNDWGREVDSRLAAAIGRDDPRGVGAAFAEYVLPSERSRWVRRLVAPWIGRSMLSGKSYPPGDLLVETQAEIAFDSRSVLSRIDVPVVLLCGDRDQFFPAEVVEETVRLIPHCTHVTYPGKGHMRVASSRRVAHDVLAHLGANEARAQEPPPRSAR